MDRDKLFHENMGLVNLALRRLGINFNDDMFEDYRQVGYIGLLKAAKRFNPDLGFAFSTYAIPMIIGEIRREMRDNSSLIHVARTLKDRYYQYRQLEKKGFEDKEICKKLNVSMTRLCEIKAVYDPVEYLDAPRPGYRKKEDDKDVSLADTLSTESNPEDESIVRVDWERVLSNLTECEKACVELRSGGFTQHQIAKKVGVSQAWVSRTLIRVRGKIAELMEGAA